MTPRQALEQRGIYNQSLLASWNDSSKDFWKYPVYAPNGEIIAHRLKRYPHSDKKMKYGWDVGKPSNPDSQWYILPKAWQAIKEADGVMYLANGEPASLAYHEAGIHNVGATTLSEIAFPKDGANYLKSNGVSRIIYIPDNDMAGYESAIIWRDALRGTGIDFEACTWGKAQETRIDTDKQGKQTEYRICTDIPEKADANDIWISVGFDKALFQAKLSALRTLSLPAPKEALGQKPVIRVDFTEAHSKLAHDILEALSAKGYLTGKKFRSGFYQTICPYHDEQEASAGYDPTTGVINCFKCKQAHGIKDNASALGIDWHSYFPKQESKKKPKKADIQAFAVALDAIPDLSDNRSYEDIIADEIMGRELSFESGQFLGFGQWVKLPLAILSAAMTLSNGRSSLALFLGRLHEALVTGQCSSVLTECEIVRITQLPRNTVFRCLLEAELLGFVQILRGINNIYTIQAKVSAQNPNGGRPTETVYLIEWDASEIKARLSKMLEIYYLEKHAKRALAMPSMQMARQLATGEDGLRLWQEKVKAALSDTANKEAKRAFDTEMFGNGGTWKGWVKAIDTSAAAPLNFFDYADSQELRAAILKWWVEKVRSVNSREELCRLLGCTDPVIDKVMEKAGVISEKQTKKVDILKLPSTVKGMAYEWSRVQRELHGKSWRGGFWDATQKAWIPFDTLKDCLDTYSKFAGKITKAYMLVQCPSAQRLMTDEELAERAASEAETVRESPSEGASSQASTPKTATPKGASSERKTYSYQKWDKHTYAFLYRQLQLLVHCFTAHTLTGHSIVDKKGQALASGDLQALWAWFQDNASAKQGRKVKSFYGKDYDEDVDFAALQALADERKAQLGISESIEFEEDVSSLPIFDDMPKQGVMYQVDNELIYVPF